jgi:histidinol phosphatase-like enzyme|tara:strand:+ start:783 stop:1160 length:378 start_codon:yes stop_codon:yes gene_type:complete
MIYVVDIDGTIAVTPKGQYEKSVPRQDRIKKLNKLRKNGNTIIFYTARGMGRFNNDPIKAHEAFYDLTFKQLTDWGCEFDALHMGKFHADYFVDDKGIQCDDFFGGTYEWWVRPDEDFKSGWPGE